MRSRRTAGSALRISALCALLLVSPPGLLASETLYLWTDEQGLAHLQRQPPEGRQTYQPVSVPDAITWRTRPELPDPVTGRSERSPEGRLAEPRQSVYPVVFARSLGSELPELRSGAAVAISDHLLLTTCDVAYSNGRDPLVGLKGVETTRAELVARDFVSDRCVLNVSTARLHAVPGVRRVDTLELGERIFAAGGPGNAFFVGDLAGLQELDGERYLATTAAISATSRGGGLFDAGGNLLGIITTIWMDGQLLVVAIPAEDFWK